MWKLAKEVVGFVILATLMGFVTIAVLAFVGAV